MINLLQTGQSVCNNHPDMMALLYKMSYAANGNILEIGTDRGGSALVFMQALFDRDKKHYLVTVDPWGNKPYPRSDGCYGDDRERAAMLLMAQAGAEYNIRWCHYRMTAHDFFAHVQQLGYWHDRALLEYRWSLVFLDGEHIFDSVEKEVKAVLPFMKCGGVIIIDNANHGGQDRDKLIKLAESCATDYSFINYSDGDEIMLIQGVNA